MRDPHGFRPLALGRLGDAWVVCSETCALDLIGATYVRDVEPGEVLIIGAARAAIDASRSRRRRSRTASSSTSTSRGPTATCSARASTRCAPSSAASSRARPPSPADVVVPIPDSGVCAAIGYAEESGIPMRFGLIRNHYVGRTFIEPAQSIRHFGVKVKLNPVRSILEGKRVVLIDDSIVRGTTSRKIVKMVRAAGAARSAPAHQLSADRLALLLRRRHAAAQRADRRHAHARRDPQVPRAPTTLGYLSLEGLLSAVTAESGVVLHVVLHRPLSGGVPARSEAPTCSWRSSSTAAPRRSRRRSRWHERRHRLPLRRRRHRRRQRNRPPHQVDRPRHLHAGRPVGDRIVRRAVQPRRGGWTDPVLVSSADGVGTKLKVAFMAGVHDTIGRDLVNHCVNDILVQGASRSSSSTTSRPGGCRPTSPSRSSPGWRAACRDNGCALLGGETAEMPGFYADGEYDVAGFIVGAVERSRLVDGRGSFRATCSSACRPPGCTPTATRWRAASSSIAWA